MPGTSLVRRARNRSMQVTTTWQRAAIKGTQRVATRQNLPVTLQKERMTVVACVFCPLKTTAHHSCPQPPPCGTQKRKTAKQNNRLSKFVRFTFFYIAHSFLFQFGIVHRVS